MGGIRIHNPFKRLETGVRNTARTIRKQPLKGIAQVAFTPASLMYQNKKIQGIFDNKTFDQLSLGLSGDFAGVMRTSSKLGMGQHVAKEDWNDSLRFAAKVGGGYVLAGAASAGGGGFVSTTAAKAIASPLTTYATAQAVQGSIKSGNYAGALAQAGGFDVINEIAPGAGDFLNGLLPAPSRPAPPSMGVGDSSQYWGAGDVYGAAAPQSSSMAPLLLIGGVILFAALMARR